MKKNTNAGSYQEPQTLRQHKENRLRAYVNNTGSVFAVFLHGDEADFMKAIRNGLPRFPTPTGDEMVIPEGCVIDADGRGLSVLEMEQMAKQQPQERAA